MTIKILILMSVLAYAPVSVAEDEHEGHEHETEEMYKTSNALAKQVKIFKNWAVACNNVLDCEAISFISPPSDTTNSATLANLSLHIKRSYVVASVPQLSLERMGDTWSQDALGKPVSIQLGEKEFALGDLTRLQLDSGVITIPSDQSIKLLEAMQGATELEVLTNSVLETAYLDGLKAALLYMDEKQQRLDTASAFIKKGANPPKNLALKNPSLQPIMANAEIKVPDTLINPLITKIRARKDLKECFWEEGIHPLDFVDVLDNQHYLVGITCWAGPYNAEMRLLVGNHTQPEKAKFAQFKSEYKNLVKDSQLKGEIVFEPSTGVLSNYDKGRSMGDCGTSSQWAWTGKQFELAQYEAMPECRGSLRFLNVWQAQLQPAKVQ